jgi:solute carrier family 25 (mitochondrial phosphate transporter), member 23/24/25/41
VTALCDKEWRRSAFLKPGAFQPHLTSDTASGACGLQVIAGAAAGALTKTSVAPIERLKVIFQTQGMRTQASRYNSPIQSLRLILMEEGVRGLYKGNGANCLRVIPVYALKFSLNDAFTESAAKAQARSEHLAPDAPLPPLSFWSKIAAGSAAGVIQITLTYPLDLVRTRLQLAEAAGASYRGIGHCLRDTYTREGPLALYKGLLPSMMAGVPYVGLQMTFFSELKHRLGPFLPLREDGSPTVGALLTCGSLAGISAQTLSYPLDTVRHRMQANGIGGQAAVYSGTWDCISKIAAREGVRGFFKGWGLNTFRALPGAAVQFTSYDTLKRWLGV